MSDDPVQWAESLPEALKEAPYFKPPEDGSHRTVEQVVADLKNAAALQGNLAESHIKIPPPDASAEDKQAFAERVLGIDPSLMKKPEDHSPIPDSVDGYKDPEVEGVDLGPIKDLALANKWSQAQYEAWVAKTVSDTKAADDQQTLWVGEQDRLLGEALGAAKADHIARTAAALRDINPGVAEAVIGGKVDASIVLALDTLVHQIMEMGGESSNFNQQAGAGARALTPSEAASKCNEIRTRLTTERLPHAEVQRLQGELVEYQRLAMAS